MKGIAPGNSGDNRYGKNRVHWHVPGNGASEHSPRGCALCHNMGRRAQDQAEEYLGKVFPGMTGSDGRGSHWINPRREGKRRAWEGCVEGGQHNRGRG